MWNWWFLLCSWLTGTGASDSAPFIITDHPARRKAEERSQLGPLGQPKGPSATLSPGQSRSATWAFRSDEDKAPTWTLSEKGIPCHPLQQEGKTYHGCHPDGWCCLDITCSKTDHCDMATKDQATPGPPLRLPRDPVTTPCELDAGGETFHWDPEEDLNLMFLLLQEDVEGLQEEDLESLVKLSCSQPLRIFEALKPPIPRATSTWDALDYALRMVESAAFSLHSLFGLSEPCHGILHQLTDGPRGHLVHPFLFFPITGAMLALVAVTNFSAKKHLVLVAQCYVVAFHTGGAAVHLKVGHHPVAALGPGGFVLLGFLVLWLQQDLITALLGTGSCVVLGLSLSAMLVKRKEGTDALLEDQ